MPCCTTAEHGSFQVDGTVMTSMALMTLLTSSRNPVKMYFVGQAQTLPRSVTN